MFASVPTSDGIALLALKARRLRDHKTNTIIDLKALHRHSLHYHKTHEESKSDTTAITAFTISQDNKENIKVKIAIKDNKEQFDMVRIAMTNGDTWCNTGWRGADSEPTTDRRTSSLLPLFIKTSANLAASETENGFAAAFRGEFGLYSQPNKMLGVTERRQEKEEKEEMAWFKFENPNALLEQTGQAHLSTEDEASKWISDTIDTKDSTEEQNITGDTFPNDGNLDQVGNEDDNSTIASSSSSAVFEFFDDLSVLTDEDSIDGDFKNDDNEGFDVNLHTFEDISLLTDDIAEEHDVMVFSLAQFDFFETRYYHEKNDSMDDFFAAGEKIIYTGSKDNNDSMDDFFATGAGIMYTGSKDHNNLLDVLSGANCDAGFSPSDELRLA